MQRQMKLSDEQIDELQTEIGHLRLQSANSIQHWKTIEMLFEKDKNPENVKISVENFSNKEIQAQTGLLLKLLKHMKLFNEFLFRNLRQMHQHRCNGRYFRSDQRNN